VLGIFVRCFPNFLSCFYIFIENLRIILINVFQNVVVTEFNLKDVKFSDYLLLDLKC